MNITITFRHMEPSLAIKAYAQDKVSKLQKFLRQPMIARVTLSVDKLKHVAEARVSSGGDHLEAKEQCDDMYASIDKVLAKLERQVRGTKGAKRAKARRGGATVRRGITPAPLGDVVEEAGDAMVEQAMPLDEVPVPPKKARSRARGTTKS